MAIIFYVSDKYKGYGDFMFGLNAVAALKKKLAEENGYTGEIVIVTGPRGKNLIKKIGSDKEFGITVLTESETLNLIKNHNLQIDYGIEGPVFDDHSLFSEFLEEKTPVL